MPHGDARSNQRVMSQGRAKHRACSRCLGQTQPCKFARECSTSARAVPPPTSDAHGVADLVALKEVLHGGCGQAKRRGRKERSVW